jgi:hypothetical protein
MIKKLLLTTTLLAPGLAYGQVSAPLDPPVVPAPAAAAGFTTPALNADFSQSTYSNIATWVDGCGGPTSGLRWLFRVGGAGNFNPSNPCSRLIMETDTTIGKQVLHLQSLAAEGPPGGGVSFWFMWPQLFYTTPTSYLPFERYTQIVFRMSSSSLVTSGSGTSNSWGTFDTIGGQTNWIEPDMFEVQINTVDANNTSIYGDGSIEYCNGTPFCNGIFSSPTNGERANMTVYHTFGSLFTSDGTTRFEKCDYLDGTLVGCAGFNPNNPSDLTAHAYTYTGGWGGTGTSNNTDIYIQDVQVWSCANWQSQACPGTVITH